MLQEADETREAAICPDTSSLCDEEVTEKLIVLLGQSAGQSDS